ncbi:MAG: TAXI family TRAP transporter solute-binding subunit [Proteobacteria bacterium]|nr:TAXI family TRAP transporter solute-binding subunit [Pseudomonadota bacterium]
MKGKKALRFLFISFTLLILTLSFQGPPARGEVTQLSMGTATVGGIFYNIGMPVAQCVNKAWPEVNITAEITQGSTENLRLIAQKKIQLAVITPMIGVFARKGIRMFKGKPADSRAVVRLLPNANIWAVLTKSKVKSIPELKGKKVGVGPASGGLGVVARSQLTANGIEYKKDIKPFFLGAGAMAEALKDGTVEGTILTGELAQMVTATHKIRILPWDEKTVDAFITKNPYYAKYTYPPNYFKGVDYPVLTVDNGVQLICQKDADEDLIYKLAKTIVENLDCVAKIYAPAKTITPEFAASELANPFHPGAIKYFKEKGIWKK